MKPKRIVLGVMLLVLAAAIGIQFHHPTEPVYQGRALTQWLKQSEANTSATNFETCNHAIRAIGTNGIPTLFKLMEAKQFPGAEIFQRPIGWLGWNVHCFDPTYKPRLASIGFYALGEIAKPAEPALIKLARTSSSPMTRAQALWCLELIKTDKQIFLPELTRALKDPDPKTATFASQRLLLLDPDGARTAINKARSKE